MVGQRRQTALGPGRTDQGYTDRQPVRAETGRHRDGRQIAEIDEIGEGPQPAVRPDRIGRQLRQCRAERRGRNQQRVAGGEQVHREPTHLRQPMEGVEGIDGTPVAAAFDDGAGDRKTMLHRKICQGGGAFGDPGAVIEQARDLQERRDIGRLGVQQFGGPMGGGGDRWFAQRIRIGEPHAERRRQRGTAQVGKRRMTGIRIGRIVAGDHPLHRQGRIHRSREHRNRVDRAAGRHHAAGGHAADGRLQPNDIAERGWNASRSRRVGAQCKGHDASGDRAGGAGRRTAGHSRRIEHIARNTVGTAHADQTGGELIQVGLADQDRSSIQ